MEGQMRVTVIATGFEDQIEQPVKKPALKAVKNEEEQPLPTPIVQEEPKDPSYNNLKKLASAIKDENPEFTQMPVNFDIPTFLRKHAD